MTKRVPIRQCIGCQEMKEKPSMIRVIKTQDDQILLDPTGKANGRGAYLCNNRTCLEKVCKSRGLDRAFKMKVPADVYTALMEAFDKLEAK